MSVLFDGLGDAIQEIRKGRNLTQTRAAERAEVSSGSWTSWESGGQLGRDMLPKILKGLGCTENELWATKAEIERRHYEVMGDEDLAHFTPQKRRLIESGHELLEQTNASVEELRDFIRQLGAEFKRSAS